VIVVSPGTDVLEEKAGAILPVCQIAVRREVCSLVYHEDLVGGGIGG
jgi:hypothetical protein